MNIRWSSQTFPSDSTAGVSSRSFTDKNKSISLTKTVGSSFVCTSPLAVITVVGLFEVVTVSNSAEFKAFLLIMCIDAPESTTNSLSSGSIFDGEGRHHFSVSEKKVDSCFSFSFRIFFASLHAASRAHRSCHSLFLRPILKFWGVGVSLLRITWANYSKRCFLVSSDGVTQCGFW